MFTKPSQRFVLLFFAISALLTALWGGLVRSGWTWPTLSPWLMAHGPLMVAGFLGTLIGVERAVALNKSWLYSGPVLSAAGSLYYIFGGGGALVGPLLITLGSLGLLLVFGVILRRHLADYTIVMAVGALAWFVGNLLWLLGRPIFQIVLWWSAFLVLTIVGERLELARLVRPSRIRKTTWQGAMGIYLMGMVLSVAQLDTGVRVLSLGMILMAAWLLRYDIARRTVRMTELPRFVAVCLLSGYVWLGIGGAIGLFSGMVIAGPLYDAFLHTVFVGFVFALIFGHAAIVFPSVLQLPVQYSRAFYYPLILLHISLGMRIVGDLATLPPLRLWGSLFNAISILLFLGIMGRTIFAGRKGGMT